MTAALQLHWQNSGDDDQRVAALGPNEFDVVWHDIDGIYTLGLAEDADSSRIIKLAARDWDSALWEAEQLIGDGSIFVAERVVDPPEQIASPSAMRLL